MRLRRNDRLRNTVWIFIAVVSSTLVIVSAVYAGPIGLHGGGHSWSSRHETRGEGSSRSSSHVGSGRVYTPSARSGNSRTRSSSPAYRPSDRSRGYRPSYPTTRYRPNTSVRDYRPGTSTRDYRPSVPTRDYRPDTRRSYTSGTSATRSRVFERVGERTRTSTSYRPEYQRYYRSGYYRPYTGWRAPRYDAGLYYYSWPYEVEPFRFGFYVWDYDPAIVFRSAYFYFGYFPYVYRDRVVVVHEPVVIYKERPVVSDYCEDDYYLARPKGSVGPAIDDVQHAWSDDQPGLLLDHIRTEDKIAVYLDGSYAYSMKADDYIAMTRDAFDRVRTVSFVLDKVRQADNGDVIAYGRHEYRDPEDAIKTVYVSYTFEKVGGNWFIKAVGSSDKPLGN